MNTGMIPIDLAPAAGTIVSRKPILVTLALVILAGGALRLYAALEKPAVGWGEAEYLMAGRNLWRGNGLAVTPGHPFTIHPALHGIVVAGMGRIFETEDLARVNDICFALFGGAACLAMYFLAAHLFGPRTGLLAAALYAFIPAVSVQMYYWESTSESLTLFLMIAACYAFARTFTGNSPAGAIIGSAILGVAACVRNDGMVIMACVLSCVFLAKLARRQWNWVRALTCGAVCVVVFCVAYAPYGAFLWRHTRKVTTAVALVNLTTFDSLKLAEDHYYAKTREIAPALSVVDYVRNNPLHMVKRILVNGHQIFIRRPVDIIPFYVFLFLGIGLFMEPQMLGRGWRLLFMLSIFLPVLAYAPFQIEIRFLVLALPAIVLLSARGLDLVATQWKVAGLWLQLLVCFALLVHSAGKVPSLRRAAQHEEYKQAASWVQAHSESKDILMALSPMVSYYADRGQVEIPIGDEKAVRDAAVAEHAKYVILEEERLPWRPNLRGPLEEDLAHTSPYFSVRFASWLEGHRIVVLQPNI